MSLLRPSSWNLPTVLWALNGILALLAYLIANPILIDICPQEKCQYAHEYKEREIFSFLLTLLRDAARTTAFWNMAATLVIAAFTGSLMHSTKKQWEVANRNFVATHRPKVIVRFVQGPFEDNNDRRFAWVTFANIGVLPAKIVRIRADMNWRETGGEWDLPGIMAENFPCEGLVLAPGQRHSITVTTKQKAGKFSDALISTVDREICVVGDIKYADEIGVLRETGFFRICTSPKPGSDFKPSNNPEDEYQD